MEDGTLGVKVVGSLRELGEERVERFMEWLKPGKIVKKKNALEVGATEERQELRVRDTQSEKF